MAIVLLAVQRFERQTSPAIGPLGAAAAPDVACHAVDQVVDAAVQADQFEQPACE